MYPTITTTPDFTRQEWSNGSTRAIEEPVHSLDSSLPDSHKNKITIIQYDNVNVFGRRALSYPNATFNHFAVSKFLKDRRVRGERFVDLGCGVGFSGNYASIHLNPKGITFADLHQPALQQSLDAYGLNNSIEITQRMVTQHDCGISLDTGKHTLDLRQGNVLETLVGKEADVAVAAPMFIPGICEIFPEAYGLFAKTAQSLGATLYIGHSNLSQPWINQAAEKLRIDLSSHAVARVPLQLDYSDTRQQSQIQSETGNLLPNIQSGLQQLGLEVQETGNHRYYHQLMVSQLGG